jgi:hypothetical protein
MLRLTEISVPRVQTEWRLTNECFSVSSSDISI